MFCVDVQCVAQPDRYKAQDIVAAIGSRHAHDGALSRPMVSASVLCNSWAGTGFNKTGTGHAAHLDITLVGHWLSRQTR